MRYGITPVLVETFVDHSCYRGTCYRAANWILIGQTQGRGRQDKSHTAQGTIKDIWVYPLQSHWQTTLQANTGASPQPDRMQAGASVDWAEEEFGGCALPDVRLQTRLLSLARDFYARPQANMAQACASRAKTKAAYRFLDHEKTTMDTLLQPHFLSTEARVRAEKIVLAVQDTTSLNYTAHAATEGMGPIGSTAHGPQGLHVHSTLAFSTQGTPLGFLDVQCWARDPADFGKKAKRHRLPIEEKESFKWLKSYRAVTEVQARCPGTTLVSVGDREADLYELFKDALAHPEGSKLLVRAAHDRQLHDEQTRLWETMQSRPTEGIQVLQVPRQGNRAARAAQLTIRYAAISLLAPTGHKGLPIPVWAVFAQEQNGAVGVKPLEWMLLTTIPVTITAADRTHRFNVEVARTDAEQDGQPRWATANDNRVTRVGNFIRLVRIDELPPLFNVLHGAMTLVGPRPHRPAGPAGPGALRPPGPPVVAPGADEPQPDLADVCLLYTSPSPRDRPRSRMQSSACKKKHKTKKKKKNTINELRRP